MNLITQGFTYPFAPNLIIEIGAYLQQCKGPSWLRCCRRVLPIVFHQIPWLGLFGQLDVLSLTGSLLNKLHQIHFCTFNNQQGFSPIKIPHQHEKSDTKDESPNNGIALSKKAKWKANNSKEKLSCKVSKKLF